jgi:hypothetical protein
MDFSVFSFLEYNKIIKISLDFKTSTFVFRVISVFCTLIFFFVNFVWGQGCFDIYKKTKKEVAGAG